MKKIISGIITSALLAGTLSVGAAAADEPLLILPNPVTINPIPTVTVRFEPSDEVTLDGSGDVTIIQIPTVTVPIITHEGPSAVIGNDEYDSLADAIANVEDGGSIILYWIADEGEEIVVDKCITFTLEYDREKIYNGVAPGQYTIEPGPSVGMQVRGMSYDDGMNMEVYTFYDCELVFEPNGGTWLYGDVRTDGAISGKPYRLPGQYFYHAPEGCVFRAWEIDGVEYAAQDWYEFTGDTTITAIWEDAILAAVRNAFGELVHAMPDWENDIEEVKNEMRQAYSYLIALRQAEQ